MSTARRRRATRGRHGHEPARGTYLHAFRPRQRVYACTVRHHARTPRTRCGLGTPPCTRTSTGDARPCLRTPPRAPSASPPCSRSRQGARTPRLHTEATALSFLGCHPCLIAGLVLRSSTSALGKAPPSWPWPRSRSRTRAQPHCTSSCTARFSVGTSPADAAMTSHGHQHARRDKPSPLAHAPGVTSPRAQHRPSVFVEHLKTLEFSLSAA
jgi:hypothetical protein